MIPSSGAVAGPQVPPTVEALRGFLEAAPDAIVVIDDAGAIVMLNTLTERMFGYTSRELLGAPVERLVPERARGVHVAQRGGYAADPRTRPMGEGRSLTGLRSDGTEIPVEISLSPLRTESGTFVVSIIRDITPRRLAEEQMKASLREKEVLLREIHHRVKNNLQVTSSLLRLQSAAISDPAAREAFAETQSRIRSMALVHEKLYQSTDLSRIDFTDYARSLAELLFRSYGANGRVALTVEGEPVFLSVETAVPCGLIVNELVSNALKHAFPEGRRGELVVRVESLGPQRLAIVVHDDGVGLPASVDESRLGLSLVGTLTDQLKGSLVVSRDAGTTFRVEVSEARAS